MSVEGVLVDEAAWTDEDSIRLTAALVILDGHEMRLDRAERIAAIRLGTAKGLSREVMAKRLGISATTLFNFAKRYELELPAPEEPPRLLETLPYYRTRGKARRRQRDQPTTQHSNRGESNDN